MGIIESFGYRLFCILNMRIQPLSVGICAALLVVAGYKWYISAPNNEATPNATEGATLALATNNPSPKMPAPKPALNKGVEKTYFTESEPLPITQMIDPELAELNSDYPNLEMRLSELSKRRPDWNFAADQVREAVLTPDSWHSIDPPKDQLSLADDEWMDGREFIQLNRLKLETLVAGDRLQLPLDQTNKTYEAKITQTRVNRNGTLSWQGELVDALGSVSDEDGRRYQVNFTAGKQTTSGGIFTPEGHFVVQVNGDYGWIARASTLYKQPDTPDFLIPGQTLTGKPPTEQ